MAGSDLRTVRSFCRICTSTCGILVDIDGEQVLNVRGDREHPMSRGYTCGKGRSLPQMHHHPDRIEHPLIRLDDGTLAATTWDACLDDLATRLNAVIDTHGPEAVGIYFGSGVGMDAAGYRMAQGLHAAIGTPAKFSPLTIDGTAKPLVAELVGGTPGLSGRPDYENAEFLLLIGSNPVVSHGHTVGMPNPVGLLRELTARGRVWVIDPRRTETTRLASRHLAPRPGTDYAVTAHLVRELLVDGADRTLIDQRTVGVEQLTAAVARFTAEYTADFCDVDPADLRDLLTDLRAADRVAVDCGTGVTMADSANVTQWLGWVIAILTGSMNQLGGMWFHPGFAYQLEQLELPISPPEGSFGPGPRSRPETRSFLGEWPCAALPDEIRAGNIRAVLNLGGSLVTAFPDTDQLIPALRELEVLATIEIIHNETTALSTHVMPTKDQLERSDLSLWDIFSPRIAAQYTPALVAPLGERRSTWWVLAELAARLGRPLADTADPAITDDAMLAAQLAYGRRSFGDLSAAGWLETPRELPAAWVDGHLDRLGGWRLAPELLTDQLAGLAGPAPLVLTPRRQRRRLNSQCDYLGAVVHVLIHPEDAVTAGVLDGQPVVVRSAHGQITGTARVDAGVRRGVVSVPHGHPEANVNRLTSKDHIDPITGMVKYCGIPVDIVPALAVSPAT